MVKTTKITGGADYAKVSDRLKAFRADNPRALIETTPLPQEGGMMMFKARIIKDKADENSAESTGHALQTKTGTKDFEKLETVAVGRALALLGYAVDGEIASSDEMEEFENYKQTQKEIMLFDMQEKIQGIDNLADLRILYNETRGLGKEVDEMLKARSEELKNGK
jgi:dihydroneopterin aldolase